MMYIGFSKPKGFKLGAQIIKWWMNAPFSHVYLLVYSKYTQQWLVYQASHGMVHCRTYDVFLEDNLVCAEFDLELPKDRLKACVTKAQQLLGRPYGYLGLIRIGLHKLGFPVSGDGARSFHCSEFIAALFPELVQKHETDFIEPIHLYRMLERQ